MVMMSGYYTLNCTKVGKDLKLHLLSQELIVGSGLLGTLDFSFFSVQLSPVLDGFDQLSLSFFCTDHWF